MSLIPPSVAAAAPRAGNGFRAAPLRWLARSLAWLLLAAWTVLLLAWLGLHWGILPRIEQWRSPIEQRASAALGVPVRIGGIVVRSAGWIPAVELRDVVLEDGEGRPALTLPRVAAAFSPRSMLALLRLELRFEQLLVEGAHIELRRDPLGRIFVAGLDMGRTGDDASAADWFFHQREFVVRGGSLRWTDEGRLAPPLTLTDLQLVVRNGLRRHELRIDATPDADWGDRFSLRGRFTQPLLARASDWRRWSGELFAELPRADLRELRRHVALPFDLSEGDGALRAWLTLRDGQPAAATVDLALRAVALRLAPQVEPLVISQVQGRLSAERDARGGALAARQLGFVTGDGLRWPAGDLSLRWRQREGQPMDGGEIDAQRIDIGLMAQMASRVPLGDAVHRLLAELQPQGTLSDLRARWDGSLDAPQRYDARGQIGGLTLAAQAASAPDGIGRPGLRNAGLRFSATQAGGDAQLVIGDGALELPGVFAEPLLPLTRLEAALQWKAAPAAVAGQPPALTVAVRSAAFANADLQGEFSGQWSSGAGDGATAARGARFPGRLELNGKLARAAVARVPRYLPLGVPASTRDYLAGALRGGSVAGASFRVQGDLWDFPFVRARSPQEGEFRIVARAEDLELAVVPDTPASASAGARASPWPRFTRVNGELVIDRNALEIRNARGLAGTLELSGVRGGIARLDEAPVLALDGNVRGPLTDMLGVVQTTPIGGWTGHALDGSSATGAAELQLGLRLPLDDLPASTVRGSLTLPGNELRLRAELPALGALRGRVDFTQRGFTLVGTTARLLGGEVALDGGVNAQGLLRIGASGTASAEGLRRAGELGAIARAAALMSGQASYRATLAFPQGRPEFSLSSSLVGMALDLPAPLRKAAEAPMALLLQSTPSGDAAAPRDTLRVELGGTLQAQFVRDLSGPVPRVLRGGIGVFEPAPQPASGVAAALTLPQLSVDAWQAAVTRLRGAAGDSAGDEAAGYLPQRIALRANELVAGTRHLDRVVAGLSQEGGVWRANVEAAQLNGYAEYHPEGVDAAGGRLYARLARLSLPRGEVEQVESLLEQPTPRVPALDIVVDTFELRGRQLGRLEIEAAYRGGAGPPEWRLSRLALVNPDARLGATGSWLAGGAARQRAVMDFRLELANGGALLDRLGTAGVIRGGKGELSGQVSWLGSPLSPDYASLSGRMNVAIAGGQFLKADPGAARLLGVLSLQALPRRLVLDFRDVFQEGFAFDSITGDVQVAQGVARSNNLRMRGLQAAVLMEGSADLARETQDLRVIVVPEVNAGTASLAYAAINPAVGLGTFLAQLLLRRPLTAAGTREFHITGRWEDPKVERVERAPGASVPDLDAPAAPASAPAPTPASTPENAVR